MAEASTQRHASARNLLMEAIQAEIARKRKEREAAAATLGGGGEPRKWMRKGDIEKYREAEYLKNEAEEQEGRLKKLVVPQHRDAALAAEQAAQKQALPSAQTKNVAGSAEQQHAEKAADQPLGLSIERLFEIVAPHLAAVDPLVRAAAKARVSLVQRVCVRR